MNVNMVNTRLSQERIELTGVLPHVEDLSRMPAVFEVDFGLPALPTEPGIIIICGPRQYGKSTWLEQQILQTATEFGPGSVFYLNGDDLASADRMIDAVTELLPLYREDAGAHRLFVDEITAVTGWPRALKLLADRGALREVLVVATGSKATELRHGRERLPGRKGRLDRTLYIFTPIEYGEFSRVCAPTLGNATLGAYLLTGGSPVACAHISQGRLPEYVIETVKDWVYGECAAQGRHKSSLLAVMESLIRFGGTPLGQAKLAREAGLANNTVAQGYVALLADLMCVAMSHAWDSSRGVRIRRKPYKCHFCNTLVALAWHPSRMRTAADLPELTAEAKGTWHEWAVAQELWRRAAIMGDDVPEEMAHWQSDRHEIDFVLAPDQFLEVKAGVTNPMEFAWFAKVFPKAHLTVVSRSRYETRQLTGITLEDFLLQPRDQWIRPG